jgi:hypothetical protein
MQMLLLFFRGCALLHELLMIDNETAPVLRYLYRVRERTTQLIYANKLSFGYFNFPQIDLREERDERERVGRLSVAQLKLNTPFLTPATGSFTKLISIDMLP